MLVNIVLDVKLLVSLLLKSKYPISLTNKIKHLFVQLYGRGKEGACRGTKNSIKIWDEIKYMC